MDNKQSNWDQLLPLGYAPFFLNTGQYPRLPAALLSKPNSSVPLLMLPSRIKQRHSSTQRTHYSAPNITRRSRRTGDDGHKFKVGDQVLLRTTDIAIPADSVRPADKLHSTLALLHCWNNTRQSPSASSCRRSTRFTTFSMSISSDPTCDPQKRLVPARRHRRTPL